MRKIQMGLGALFLALGLTAVLVRSGAVQGQDVKAAPAAMPAGISFGLGSLPLLSDAQTRSVSAENPTGEKGKGAMTIPKPGDPDQPFSSLTTNLGRGWKTRPFLSARAGQTVTLMDVKGPGIIQHIWVVCAPPGLDGRACVLRCFWDNEETPSIEVPVTDFFAVGHNKYAQVDSVPVAVNPANAMNCFWPMPFGSRAKITFSNNSKVDIGVLAYQITYLETPIPENAGRFHAQYRRQSTADQNPYVILDGVKGQGRYVGTFLAVSQLQDGWFGEGEIKFFLDGDKDFPTICGTGLEDYFLHSYGFPAVTSKLYSGAPLKEGPATDNPGGGAGMKWSLYRWHIMDPICFQQDIRVTLQSLGPVAGKPGWSKRSDDFSSVAYWYQSEPHAAFPALPPMEERVRAEANLPATGK